MESTRSVESPDFEENQIFGEFEFWILILESVSGENQNI